MPKTKKIDKKKKSEHQILIVDDEKNITQMLSRHFRFLGYNVKLAKNGMDALKVMSTDHCDIVISDIKMPIMDGVELLNEIKQQYPMTPVIMMTGYVSVDNILNCIRYGADTCVYKPFEDIQELELAVEQAVQRLCHWQEKLDKLLELNPEPEL